MADTPDDNEQYVNPEDVPGNATGQDSGPIAGFAIDDIFSASNIGSIERAIGNNLFGINHRQISTPVPSNKDQYGLTFFTRPQLNLQNDNLRSYRLMFPLLTSNVQSMQRFVRTTLDPRLMAGYDFLGGKIPPIKCPMVDPLQAFIPILTNNLNTISGWPDKVVPTYSSKAGLYKEVYSQVDGINRQYGEYDIDASFRNTRGDPIIYLLSVWEDYACAVFEGKMSPYLDMISENEIDYMTRIYRIVLDQSRDRVTKISACGVAFPTSVPTGSFFDFNKDTPFNDQNKDITIRFHCLGADFGDTILMKEFNETVCIFNPDMADGVRENKMVKITKNIVRLFNNRGYPRINTSNNELEWWVTKKMFDDITMAFLNIGLSPDQDDITGTQFNGD